MLINLNCPSMLGPPTAQQSYTLLSPNGQNLPIYFHPCFPPSCSMAQKFLLYLKVSSSSVLITSPFHYTSDFQTQPSLPSPASSPPPSPRAPSHEHLHTLKSFPLQKSLHPPTLSSHCALSFRDNLHKLPFFFPSYFLLFTSSKLASEKNKLACTFITPIERTLTKTAAGLHVTTSNGHVPSLNYLTSKWHSTLTMPLSRHSAFAFCGFYDTAHDCFSPELSGCSFSFSVMLLFIYSFLNIDIFQAFSFLYLL